MTNDSPVFKSPLLPMHLNQDVHPTNQNAGSISAIWQCNIISGT